MKSVGTRWLVRMCKCIRNNYSHIVNDLLKAGIPQAIGNFQLFSANSGDTICDSNSDVDSTDSDVDLIDRMHKS